MSPAKKSPTSGSGSDHQVSTRAQIERLYGIVAKVQNNEANKLMDLAMAYEVNTRTIQRDIEFLRERLGVPIAFDRKENRYAIEDDFAHIPPLELRETDFLLLSFLQQCLAPHAATEIGAEMNKSFERLFGLLTGTRKWKEWAEPILWRSENVPRGNPKELKIFHLLQRAITRKKEVTFHYKPLRKQANQKTIRPLLLMMHKGRWYLYGVIAGKMEITPFSFDRISEVEITATGFDPADYPDPRALLRHSFGVAISSDPPFDVVLEFESRVAERFAGYCNPGKSQATSKKCHQGIRKLIKQGKTVRILVLPQTIPLKWGDYPINLAAGLEEALVQAFKPEWNGSNGKYLTETQSFEEAS